MIIFDREDVLTCLLNGGQKTCFNMLKHVFKTCFNMVRWLTLLDGGQKTCYNKHVKTCF